MNIEEMTIKELREVAKLASALTGGCNNAPVTTASGEKCIVVLQRGWVAIGTFYQCGDQCRLEDASVIRQWGTTKGLGELINGPTSKTVLDPCGTLKFHELTIVTRMEVNAEKWK